MARSAAEPDDRPGWERVVAAIGPKLRDLRQQAGLSLQQLAQRADVSAAAIHKVERGDMIPTITTLLKLADALERPIGHFVGDETPAPVASVVAAGAGAEVTEDGVARTAITAAPERFRVGGAAVVIDAGAEGASGGRQAGEELVHLLEGALEIEVGGERHVLGAGDTVQFPADRHARWRNPGPGPTRAVWLTAQGR